MGNNYQILIEKLDAFIRKYYKNRLLKGVIYSLGLLLASFIIITTLEYFVQFSITGRTVLFYLFLVSACYLLINFVAIPLSKLYKFGKVINHDQAAEIIGNHFEEVNDKLINVLQLEHKALKDSNELLLASIDQKSLELKPVPFSRAIDLSENKQYLKYLIIPLILIFGISVLSPKIFDLLENLEPGVGGEIQLTDALRKLLGFEGLNALKTDADVYDCGNKLGFLSANLAVGMRDPKSSAFIHKLFNKLTDSDV